MTSLDHSWEGKQRGTYLIFVFRKKLLLFFIFHLFSCSKEIAKDAIIYSYQRHINGFSANLEEEMAAEIASEFIEACKQFHSLYMYIYIVLMRYILTAMQSIQKLCRFF